MRKSLFGTIVLSLLTTSALSSEMGDNKTAEPTTSGTAQVSGKKLPGLATLIAPGENIASGDMIAINRPFENWALMCDYRLSQNKRICVIEQVLGNNKTHVRWRVATTVDRKPLLVISIPTHIVLSSGLRLGFAELEKTIPEAEWFCTAQTCITGFPFEGFLQAAIQSSPDISFSFSIRSDENKETNVRLVGSMSGFADAVKAATTDPFGTDIVATATVNDGPAKSPAKPTKPIEAAKKPIPQSKASKVDRSAKQSVQEAKNTREPVTGLY